MMQAADPAAPSSSTQNANPTLSNDDDDNCMFFDEDEAGVPAHSDEGDFEDLLNLSAHSSGSGGSHVGEGDDDALRRIPQPPEGHCSDDDQDERSPSNYQSNTDDGIIADGLDANTGTDGEEEEGTANNRKEMEKLQRLAADANLLMQRFATFHAAHPQLPGLSKLRTRFEREVELAMEAVSGQPLQARGGSQRPTGQPTQGQKRQDGGVSVNRPSYIKCNCIPLLELTLHVLENETNVVSVMHPINPVLLQKVVQRGRSKLPVANMKGADDAALVEPSCRSGYLDRWELPSVAFEVDIITCGGLRWMKVKGTSRRNLELELSACADRRPFSSILETIVRGATCCRQPFGVLPKLDVLIYYKPSEEVLQECGDAVEAATTTARVKYNSNGTQRLVNAASNNEEVSRLAAASSPATATHPLRRPTDERVDVTFHVFESTLKSHIVSTSSLPPRVARPPTITWSDVPLARRFDVVPQFWSRTFLPPLELQVDFINFDVTALVALCSDTCNGFAGQAIPKHSILEEQSFSEAVDPAILNYIEPCLQRHSRLVVNSTPMNASRDDGGVSAVRAVMASHISAVGGDPSKLRVGTVRGLGLTAEQRDKLGFSIDDAVDAHGFVIPSEGTAVTFASDMLRRLREEETEDAGEGPSASAGTCRRRNWIVSDVALSEFLWIVGTIAGAAEYRRAAHLLKYMFVVSSASIAEALVAMDNATSSPASASPQEGGHSFVLRSMDAVFHLENTGKLADRHKAVFGLGNAVHAVSISANKQFTQAARDQGIEVCVCHHPSRALTERKRLGGDRMDGPRKPPALQKQSIDG